MTESVEAGAALAWRLLATLEGGSLILATSALLAYSARSKLIERNRKQRPIKRVLVTNIENRLGRELKRQLEVQGCAVTTVSSGSGVESYLDSVDALVVVGAELKENTVDGMANLVSQDVYDNIKLLETLSRCVRRGGRISWACAGADTTSGAYSNAASAYDAVLLATLRYLADKCECEPVWVSRCDAAERAAELVVAALMPSVAQQLCTFSVRNAVLKAGEYFCRRLKIIN